MKYEQKTGSKRVGQPMLENAFSYFLYGIAPENVHKEKRDLENTVFIFYFYALDKKTNKSALKTFLFSGARKEKKLKIIKSKRENRIGLVLLSFPQETVSLKIFSICNFTEKCFEL